MRAHWILGFALALTSCGKARDSSVGASSVSLSSSSLREAHELPAESFVSLPEKSPGPTSKLDPVRQALDVTNEIRRLNKLPELVLDEKIARAAQGHAEDMLRRHYFDHNNPEGLTPFQRMQKAGVTYRAAAENIAMGYSNPREVFQGWLDSSGHRHNLLNKIYLRHGIGFAGGYWVHEFAD